MNKYPRLAENPAEVYKLAVEQQLIFNTLGDGRFFVDAGGIMQKMIEPHHMRKATENEINDLHKWLDRDMIRVEHKRGFKYATMYYPHGMSYEKIN